MTDPSRTLGLAICRAFDIDPDHVVGITINLRVGEFPTMTVESVVIDEQAWDHGGDLASALTQYELKPIGEDAML